MGYSVGYKPAKAALI